MPRLIREREFVAEPEIEKRELCFEGADVILDFRDGKKRAVHSDVLRETGDFFGLGSKPAWTEKATIIKHPTTGADMKVLKYSLVHDPTNKIITLEAGDSNLRESWDHPDSYPLRYNNAAPFYLSNTASGFVAHGDDDVRSCVEMVLEDSQLEHRVAFSLLYRTEPDLQGLTYRNIANIVAMTELYGFVDLVAPALRDYLLTMTGLWNGVRDNFCFHLALAKKLRCKEVYCDALRHYIGSNVSVRGLADMVLDSEQVIDIAEKREELQHKVNELQVDLQALSLTTYIPPADRQDHGEPAKTSYLSSSYDFGYINQSTDIAHRMVMEWYTQQISGTPHWSHVRQYKGHDGHVFERGSLRNICNLTTHAVQTGTELSLFDPNAAERLVDQADLIGRDTKPYAVHFVEEEAKKIVGQIANMALPYIASPFFEPTVACADVETGEVFPDQGRHYHLRRGCFYGGKGSGYNCRGRKNGGVHHHNHFQELQRDHLRRKFERVGVTAQDDRGCHYFTCIDIKDEDLPWDEDFEDFKDEDVKEASDAWLKTIGVLEKDGDKAEEQEDDEA